MTKKGFDINELRLGPGLIMGLVSFSAALVLDIYLLPNKGKIIGFSFLASMACIYTARPMLRYAGAKAFIIGYVVLHLALIFVPLTDSDFPGPVLIPFFIADYVAMVFGLRLCTVPTME